MQNMLLAAAGTIVGGLVTWFVSWWYYRRAGQELRDEARELQRLTTLILHALHASGLAEVKWTPDGKAQGINITIPVPPGEIRVGGLAPTVSITNG